VPSKRRKDRKRSEDAHHKESTFVPEEEYPWLDVVSVDSDSYLLPRITELDQFLDEIQTVRLRGL